MEFRIADSFTAALCKLTRDEEKAVKSSVFDLQTNPELLKEGPSGEVRIGVMHLAKGLEFKAVAVIACDEDQLPLRSRVEVVADEVGLDDVYATERHLFYAARTHLIQSRRTGHRIDLTR